MVNPAEQGERVGIIHGAISPEDESFVVVLLDRLGMQVTFQAVEADIRAEERPLISSAASTQFLRRPPHLKDIISPSDWLVREHFDMHQGLTRSQVATGTVTRAFHHLIDTRDEQARHEDSAGFNRQNGTYIYNEEAQAYPIKGLVVAERTGLGFIPYNAKRPKLGPRARSLAKFAVQAGSLLEAQDEVQATTTGHSTQAFISSLISRLNRQVQI